MKLLQVTNVFAPAHGGSAEVPYQLSKELAKREHGVTVYTSDSKLSHEYINSVPRVKIWAFKTWVSSANLFVAPGIVKKAKEETRHFDVIHMHGYRTFQNIAVAHYARKYNVPYVLQAHGSLPRIMVRQGLKQAYDSLWGYRLLRDASRVIAVARIEAQQYRDAGLSEDKIEIVPNGIDLSEFDNLPRRERFREKYGLSNNEKVILSLGRIHKVKGLDLLAKAFAQVLKDFRDVKLVITGPDTGYLPTLMRLVKELEIEEKVLFTGPLYGKDKLEAYVDAEVYVLPSFYEIFGITVLEALACGTPIIVTDRCGIADSVNSARGYVVPFDKQRLAEVMLNVLKGKTKKPVKGREFIEEHFTWSKIAEQIEKIYESIKR